MGTPKQASQVVGMKYAPQWTQISTQKTENRTIEQFDRSRAGISVSEVMTL